MHSQDNYTFLTTAPVRRVILTMAVPTVVSMLGSTSTILPLATLPLCATARNGFFFIPLILVLPRFFGLLGVEMCQSWCDILSFLLAVPIAISGLRALKD